MANGETIKQVKELLQSPDTMTIKTGIILTLTLMAEQYEKYNADHTRLNEIYPLAKESAADHIKMDEIYPWAKERKDNGKNNERVAVGAAITSTVVLFIHAITSYLGVKAP